MRWWMRVWKRISSALFTNMWPCSVQAVHMGHCVLWVMHISFANCVHRQVSVWFGLRAPGTPLKLTQTQQIVPDTRLTRRLSLCVDVKVSTKVTMTWRANFVDQNLNVHMIHICIFDRYNGSKRHLQRVGGGSIKADKNLIMDRHLFVDQRRPLWKGSL